MRILGTQRAPIAQVHVEEIGGVHSHTEPGGEGERVKGVLIFSGPHQAAPKWFPHSASNPHRAVEGRCPPYTTRVREAGWNTMEWPAAAGALPPEGITSSQRHSLRWKRYICEEKTSTEVRPVRRQGGGIRPSFPGAGPSRTAEFPSPSWATQLSRAATLLDSQHFLAECCFLLLPLKNIPASQQLLHKECQLGTIGQAHTFCKPGCVWLLQQKQQS